MIQETSLKAWHELQDNLSAVRKEVFEPISAHPNSTDNEIAQIFDWEINRVAGRANEPRKTKPQDPFMTTDGRLNWHTQTHLLPEMQPAKYPSMKTLGSSTT